MKINNGVEHYGALSIALHWLMALLIFAIFALGLWMVDLNYYHKWYRAALQWHKSMGILIFALWLFRLFWRWIQPRPSPLKNQSRWETLLAGFTHSLLYLLIFLIILSGYLISTADGKPLEVFDRLVIPPLMPPIQNQADLAGQFHYSLAIVLISLVVLHASAAFKHHFHDKDNTLRRIVNPNPPSKTNEESQP